MANSVYHEGTEPWQWEEPQWRRLVSQVRAGRTMRPQSWPAGAKCAVALSFDCDHESSELRDGGKSVGRLSWGEFGSRVAVPAILERLRSVGAEATFFVPAVVALLHETEQERITGEGHEIGLHGWIHEINSSLPAVAERELMLRSADTLERITKIRPVGIRTPSWDFSPHTLSIIREMGLLYDSSLMADHDCYELLSHGEQTGIVEVPVEWIRDDAAYLMMNRFQGLRPYTSPDDVFNIFRREFEAAYEDGGLFQLTLHPHIIGHRSRIWILDELLRVMKGRQVWFASHARIAEWVKLNSNTEFHEGSGF